jgi:glycosyltransferase involved in cell wall biosynthesis
MNEQPLVSVVVPFLDVGRFLAETVESVLAQTWANWELFLVDDGSTDESVAIARGYAAADPRVHYLEHDGHRNRGISASRNLGIQHATGRYIALLDGDDVLLPEKLAFHVAILEEYPEVGMVYGKSIYWYSWTGDPADRAKDRVQPHWIVGEVVVDPPRLVGQFITGRAGIPGICGVLARRSAVVELGGFEEDFPGMYEDQVFFSKMCMTHPVYVSESCLERYRQHPESISAVEQRAGALGVARRRFLGWLADELRRRKVQDPEVWQAVRREVWLARERPGSGGPLERRLRWLDKWRLRLEDSIVPAGLRRRIWEARVPTLPSMSRFDTSESARVAAVERGPDAG